MVPKLFKAGQSFKSLSAYLLHDPDKARSDARVRWTHTLNLASDDAGLAVDEMLWTYRSAEDLKRDSGARSGGRPLKHPVRHFSLNWHPSETPTKEHMIATVDNFLSHMKWNEHQALIVCHDDKHPHVHVMLNAVHPVTGRALDAAFEQRRAQAWAVEFEREQGQIFCEERLKPIAERQASPTREAWQATKQAEKVYTKAEVDRVNRDFDYFKRNDEGRSQDKEWEAIKAFQKDQRQQFFVDGKQAYRAVRNEVFVEVRQEFKEQWREYYQAKRGGLDPLLLAAVKDGLVKAQREALTARQNDAAKSLRIERDQTYKALLKHQQAERHELKRQQRVGGRSYHLAAPKAVDRQSASERSKDYRATADEVTRRRPRRQRANVAECASEPRAQPTRVRKPIDIVSGIGLGGFGGIAAIGERLFDSFFGGVPAPEPKPAPVDPQVLMHKDAQRAADIQAKQAATLSESEALKHYWDQRRRRQRDRD